MNIRTIGINNRHNLPNDVSKTLWVFKLFNSIKDKHEVELAELELKALFGPLVRVRNFFDIIGDSPLKAFTSGTFRVQDVLLYEPCYGEYQGFVGWTDKPTNAAKLARRLAYTREFLIVTPSDDQDEVLRNVFPSGKVGRNVEAYSEAGFVLLRIITNQFFLEKSHYVSKLSRHERDIDRNVEALFAYPFRGLYRVPASATMAVGKRLEDYFAIREEVSLYLTHVWHPYKAKFHAKMSRALLNYVCPNDDAIVMDNWGGSGTLNVEATLMGLRNLGLEINPLSALMATVKCQALLMNLGELKMHIDGFLGEFRTRLTTLRSGARAATLLQFAGSTATQAPQEDLASIAKEAEDLKKQLKRLFTSEQLQEFVLAHKIIEGSYKDELRRLFLLALSGSISDLARRRKGRLLELLDLRLNRLMYLRLYLFHKLNETLGIPLATSATYICDNRYPSETARTLDGTRVELQKGQVDGIVTSPPYSTAVDYIRNDFPQLMILQMVKSRAELEELERNLEGNPKPRIYRNDQLRYEVGGGSKFYHLIPDYAKESIQKLRKAGRESEALRAYKFFKDMYLSLIAMNHLMKKGAKCAIVIGNNHYKLDEDNEEEVKNDRVIFELALRSEVGFAPDKETGGLLGRPLEKTQTGHIRNESVLILDKVREASAPNL
jgi:hypothetical protein